MKPLLGGCCALLMLCLSGRSDTLTIFPNEDTTISEGNKAQANGTTDTMIVGHLSPLNTSGNVPARGLLRFNVNLPPGATVDSVRLTIHLTKNSEGVNDTHALHRLGQNWLETAATWLSTGIALWDTAGSDFDPDPDATLAIGSDLGTYTFTSTPELVSTVQRWATNPAVNFGWVLRSLSEGSGRNARRFGTRESDGTQPTLTIDYTPAPPPPADFNVTSPGFFFDINGQQPNPDITVIRGSNYVFDVNTDSVHPFQLAVDQDGSSYDDGVINNNISSGRISFSVPLNAPDTLYYVCSVHFFRGTIHVINPSTPPPVVKILSVNLSSSNVVLWSTGTNGWSAVPEYSSNITVSNWTVVPQFSNSFVSGTNITVFNRLEPICGSNVFLRMKNVKN